MSVQRIDKQRLDQDDDRFRSILETVPAIVYQQRVGATTRLTYVCSQVEAILGWKPEEYVAHPRHWLERVHPLDQDRVATAVAESVASGPSAILSASW